MTLPPYPQQGDKPWGNALKAYVDASVDEAEAARDAAVDAQIAAEAVGSTNDSIVAGLIPGPSATATALSATYAPLPTRPSWLPATANDRPWNPTLGLFNATPTNLAKFRAARAKAASGVAPLHVSVIGDSQTFSAGNTAGDHQKSWVDHFETLLTADTGGITNGTGIIVPTQQNIDYPGVDSRVTVQTGDGTITMNTGNEDGLYSANANGAGGTCVKVSYGVSANTFWKVSPGIDYDEVWVYALLASPGNPNYDRIVVAQGAGGVGKQWQMESYFGHGSAGLFANHELIPCLDGYTRSDTPTTTGTLRVGKFTPATRTPSDVFSFRNPQSGSPVHILGVEFRKSTGGGVRVSNMAYAGRSMLNIIKAAEPTGDISGTRGLSLMFDTPGADLAIIAMSGTNDWNSQNAAPHAPADFKGQLRLCVQRQKASGAAGTYGHGTHADGDVMLVVMPQMDYAWYAANQANDNNPPYTDYMKACYEIADEEDVPLLDLAWRWTDYATGNAVGIFRDWVHPSVAGSVDYGRAVFNALSSV